MTSPAPVPVSESLEAVEELRLALDRVGFTGEAVKALLGSESDLLTRARDLPVHLRRLREQPGPLATLVALLVLGEPVGLAAAETALAPIGAAALERLAIARRDGSVLHANLRLVPHDELLIASDRFDAATAAAHVAAVHRPSVTLAELSVRRPVARALDLGTGNGIQAILASRHADHVVATDVNERALAFARFNARLNGAHGIDFRQGSFFEPVAGERFDLIVTNPPYVISPESEFLFRDSGLGGDRVSAEVTRGVPAHLADGGFATVMVSWIDSGGEPTERPRQWLEGSGCDAWLFHTGTDDPLRTAARWNADAASSAELEERVDRWLDYYRANDIRGVAYGIVVLRRRDGKNWVRSAELNHGFSAAGPHLERMFAAADLLDGGADVLEGRFRFAADALIEEELEPTDHGWTPRSATLKLQDGLGFSAGLDPMAARLVAAIEPGRTLRECLDAVAPAGLREAGADLVRRLLELGFIEPVCHHC